MKQRFSTREAWLLGLTQLLESTFKTAGAPIPRHQVKAHHRTADGLNVRFSCGWPSTNRKKRIGECWSKTASRDGHYEIFISPLLEDPLKVAAVVVHELCHAAVDTKCGHKGPFKTLATKIGLEGPMTSTYAGEPLKAKLATMIEQLGPYPHAELMDRDPEKKKQTTRLIKCTCDQCGYVVRTTRAWIEKALPACINIEEHETGKPNIMTAELPQEDN